MATAISAILIFLLLVTVHEFGHFIAAKASGIRVLEFAIGMGPAIAKWQRGETLYSIRIFPIGGYCKMEGEDEESDDEHSFGKKSARRRIIVLIAGAFMNVLTGFIIFIIIFSNVTEIGVPVIAELTPGYPAADIGMLPGDRIVRVNGTKINIYQDLSFEMSSVPEQPIPIVFERNGERLEALFTPKKNEGGESKIGFVAEVEQLTFVTRLRTSYYTTLFTSKVIISSLSGLLRGVYSVKEMSGPVGIVEHIGAAAKVGILDLLSLTAFITINLGVFNLLPLPALDGGRVFFILIEAVRRKKIPADKEGFVHFVGFALLILLMLFTTYNDIGRIVGRIFGG